MPSPVRSSQYAARPASAMTIASVVPLTRGPAPDSNGPSVATRWRPWAALRLGTAKSLPA